MKCAEYVDIHTVRDLGFRLSKNFARLQEAEYRPETVFSIEQNGWAGDWEGRTILALTLLEQATGQKAAYLQDILVRLETECNEKGYLKGILPEGEADEQQLSGHNWLLRGLIEHYLSTGSKRSAKLATRLVENLYLPVLPLYRVYPTDPTTRTFSGSADGTHTNEVVNGWHLSTDIGCAFMSLDGLSQYYAVFGDARVGTLIDAMIEAFVKIDFVKASMQTHASLSACRGILRYYGCTGQEDLLRFVQTFFRFYQEHGMTENYANFNWFQRPLWTEPCAYIDSFLLALELWKLTGDEAYLAFAHRVKINAMGHGQRSNGGFGCDDCTGPAGLTGLLRAQSQHYEAYWCCTMRGGEGLSTAARHGVVQDGDKIYVTGLASGEYKLQDAVISVRMDEPFGEHVELDVHTDSEKELKVYMPEGVCCELVTIKLNGQEVQPIWQGSFITVQVAGDCCVEINSPLALSIRGTVSRQTPQGLYTCWCGDVMLGVETDKPVTLDQTALRRVGTFEYTDGNVTLRPFGESISLGKEDLLKRSIQILFAE